MIEIFERIKALLKNDGIKKRLRWNGNIISREVIPC